MNIEQLLKQLQSTVEKLEKGDLSMEQSLKLFEEGVELTEKCFSALEKTKGKLNILKQRIEEIED